MRREGTNNRKKKKEPWLPSFSFVVHLSIEGKGKGRQDVHGMLATKIPFPPCLVHSFYFFCPPIVAGRERTNNKEARRTSPSGSPHHPSPPPRADNAPHQSMHQEALGGFGCTVCPSASSSSPLLPPPLHPEKTNISIGFFFLLLSSLSFSLFLSFPLLSFPFTFMSLSRAPSLLYFHNIIASPFSQP